MESDKFITVCDGSGLAIVDLSNRDSVIKLPMSAEAAIMNPVTNVLALRGTDARIALGGAGDTLLTIPPADLLRPSQTGRYSRFTTASSTRR